MEENKYVKVYFEFFNDVLDEDYVEGVWAITINATNGLYKLDNVPFFIKGYACEDVVFAQTDGERLVISRLFEVSGNSTIQIMLFDEEQAIQIQQTLNQFNCDWEGSHIPNYFSVNVPVHVAYRPIKTYLSELERNEIIGYREACLAHN